MDIEVDSASEKEIRLTLSGASTAFANAVRRTGMSRLAVFAVEKVTVYENTSPIFDEYIANRVGLIPIETPDGYSDKDTVLFTLDKDGPCTVYSKSLKSSDPKVKAANTEIPIVKLTEGQHLRLEATARLGTAKEHARHQAGVLAYGIDKKEKGAFNFVVESFGQISAKDILLKSADLLEERLEQMKKQLKAASKG